MQNSSPYYVQQQIYYAMSRAESAWAVYKIDDLASRRPGKILLQYVDWVPVRQKSKLEIRIALFGKLAFGLAGTKLVQKLVQAKRLEKIVFWLIKKSVQPNKSWLCAPIF